MTIPLILASQSVPRRNILYQAGICPTIHESHVDEPAALEREVSQRGSSVDSLSIEERVLILAHAKAMAATQSYRQIAEVASHATGERVIAYPLQASRAGSHEAQAGSVDAAADNEALDSTQTRDFSGMVIPTRTEPISATESGRPGMSGLAAGPLILGCDSMFLFEGKCYGKPHSADIARGRLRRMRNHEGELWTGHSLIDLASGRIREAASHAVVHFGDFSDDDIERYVATGEPLEVAGAFTLEGIGGAFIDRIEGDPHAVIGLSLPLLRNMVSSLGVQWPDLWNVHRGGVEPGGKAGSPLGSVPPKGNVHQPGDGWVQCACGRRHWGTNGASGVLLARRDPRTHRITHVVMQRRALWSAEGGTWGVPGGAIADGETALEGALRESFEEANITPQDVEVVGSYREDHGPWAYTTVFAFERQGHRVEPRANDDESLEIGWVPIDEVPHRKLLTAMRADWPRLRSRLDALAQNPGCQP